MIEEVVVEGRLGVPKNEGQEDRARERRAQHGDAQAAAAVRDVKATPKVIVQTADVRVVEYTMQPGDRHPWHYHSNVTDRVYCLEGLVGVETRTPAKKVVLRPGDSSETRPQTVHHVSNAGDGVSRYLLVQALGTYDYIKTGCPAREMLSA